MSPRHASCNFPPNFQVDACGDLKVHKATFRLPEAGGSVQDREKVTCKNILIWSVLPMLCNIFHVKINHLSRVPHCPGVSKEQNTSKQRMHPGDSGSGQSAACTCGRDASKRKVWLSSLSCWPDYIEGSKSWVFKRDYKEPKGPQLLDRWRHEVTTFHGSDRPLDSLDWLSFSHDLLLVQL